MGDQGISVRWMDDHVVVRDGLRALLEPQDDVAVFAEAGTVKEAVDPDADPNVVVADVVLPDDRGPDVVKRLRERYPEAAILVLTMVDTPTAVQLCLAAGARGYLLKGPPRPSSSTRSARSRAARITSSPRSVPRSRDGGTRPVASTPRRSTTSPPREGEVLHMIALGHTNAEIAQMLHVSVRTVENHRASVMRKLGLRTRAELVRQAADGGLV